MIKVKDNIYWVGIRDWDLRRFHGHELSTHRGSSYNSYLIKGNKNILIDTVWSPYKNDFVQNLEKLVGIENIDAIVINHIEPDHGGSLAAVMEKIPDVPVYCSTKGVEIIKKHFHKEWNFVPVKTGDTVRIGDTELLFLNMTMLHWPDSLATFVKDSNVLLSNDAFGQHFAGSSLFADEVDECEVMQEAIKYFANILAPFALLIKKKILEIEKLNLPIEVIAPSHGVIWRKDPMRIVRKYFEWSDNYNEGYVTIVYDTMYDSTKKMAEMIAAGMEQEGLHSKLFNASVSDISDVITEMFKSKGIIFGSCTVNNGYLRSISGILDEIKGHKFKNKLAASFGSYGWSGEAPQKIYEELKNAGLRVELEPLSVKYVPTQKELDKCVEFGRQFARKLVSS